MQYFIDTEFSENGPHNPIDLISIGIVSEDGREFYRVSSEYDLRGINPWVAENVIPNLDDNKKVKLSVIGKEILDFIGPEKPKFWGYYADYDWVVFCQIFGSMINLPKGWPMYCNDIKQLCKELGDPKLPEQSSKEHNALNDARWNKLAYEFLITHGV